LNGANHPDTPWRAGEVTNVIMVNLVGLVLIVAGYLVCRATAEPSRVQLATSIAAAGLVVTLAGNTVWLFGNLREVTRLRREVLLGPVPAAPSSAVVSGAAERPAPTASILVSSPSMSLYHRPECLMVSGKAVKASSLAAHRRARRRPCQVCLPDAEMEVAGTEAT
jgi:hypothetical protein